MAATVSIPASHATERDLRFAPSLPDLLFGLLLLALFGRPYAWQALLGDGDTGWHIRAGDYILAHGMPAHDIFSFSRSDQPWYAWEWLSDVVFAELHRCWGLSGVAIFSALLVCLPVSLLFAWLLRRRAGVWVALAASLAAASAASVHYLARPHLFSLVFLVGGLWLLDEDRRSPTQWLWALVPVAAIWSNLHGGFAAWLAILALLSATAVVQRNRAGARRYSLLLVLSSLATMVNPYGWRLHQHILSYLRSPWFAEHVQEFQSPQIRSENMLVFALLLILGLGAAARANGRARWFEVVLVFAWGFAALHSARYIPLFAVMVAPVIATQAADWWRTKARLSSAQSPVRVLWEASQALGAQWKITLWLPVLGALAVAAAFPAEGLADLPSRLFPVTAVALNGDCLSGFPAPRVLTSDQWADYLIYRLYPQVRVFYDGRSDFYGPALGDDYHVLLAGGRGSREVMERFGFTVALLPLDWPLGQLLEQDPHWRVVYRDAQAVLLQRDKGKY